MKINHIGWVVLLLGFIFVVRRDLSSVDSAGPHQLVFQGHVNPGQEIVPPLLQIPMTIVLAIALLYETKPVQTYICVVAMHLYL